MRIRKPISELKLDDLRQFPVWEYASGEEGDAGHDESTVRPCRIVGAVDPSVGMLHVRAEFQLADGTKMLGYVSTTSDGDEGLGALQPVIVTNRGQVFFWYGVIEPDAKELKKRYKILGRTAKEVFPIEVAFDVELTCTPIRATIPGFMVLEDWRSGETRAVT